MTQMAFASFGIGELIKRGRLVIPANQRPYAWGDRHVLELLTDIQGEMGKDHSKGLPEYFLGTVVLVKPNEIAPPQISDGQQRLATTTIILARIRDILNEIGRHPQAGSIQTDYISKVDLASAEEMPQLTLNKQDNSFFTSVILGKYPHDMTGHRFLRTSNEKLLKASETSYEFFKTLLKSYAEPLHA